MKKLSPFWYAVALTLATPTVVLAFLMAALVAACVWSFVPFFAYLERKREIK